MFFNVGYSALVLLFSGSNIVISIPNGGSMGFSSYYSGCVVTVTAGTLNGTANIMLFYRSQGEVHISSNSAATFYIDGFLRGVPYVKGSTTATVINDTRIEATTTNGDNLIIGWSVSADPLLPLMFILGVLGVISMIGGAVYSVKLFGDGLYEKGLVNGALFISLGFGLVLAWLFG